jgi:hypothetical protein
MQVVGVAVAMNNKIDMFPITLQQAREIALQILHHAETERLKYAEEEAKRGIDWESETGD